MLEFDRVPPDLAARYREAGYWRGERLGELLRPWARREPERVALVAAGRRYGYGELDARADRLAAGLRALGVARGDRVVVQLPNCASFAVVVVALFRLGAVPVFALPTHRQREVVYLCETAEAVAYVTVDKHLGFDYRALARQVRAAVPSLRHLLVDGDPEELTALAAIERAPEALPPPEPGDVAFFLLSGGTTGLPKLIPRTHDDYAYQLRATAAALDFDEHGVYLAALPIAHNAALGCPGLLGALRAGGKVVLATTPSPDQVFPLIAAEGVTLTTLMPPLVRLWVESADLFDVDFSRMVLQVGSQRFPPELARRARAALGCRLTQWFGMAEGLLTYTRLDDPAAVVEQTQGRPLCPADELRVVDGNDRPVAPGELGELLTRGPYTLRGYYRAGEHNARAFTADGFLRTGDLVRIGADGNMIVEGRLKDVINRGGEKIAAGEVEDLIVEHPEVREAAVVAMPDETLGERVACFIVARGDGVDLKELRAFLRHRGIADYKLPEKLQTLAALPHTKVGKVDKAQLRQLVARGVT